MLLLLVKQYLTLASLAPLLSQRGDCKDKSLPLSTVQVETRLGAYPRYFVFTKGSRSLLRKMAICGVLQRGVFYLGSCLLDLF